MIRIFATISDAESDFNKMYGAVYIYRTGNAVLTLDTGVLPDKALEYKAAFYKVVQ